VDITGTTPLHIVVRVRGVRAVKAFVGDERVDVNKSDSREHALLHKARRCGNVAGMRGLFARRDQEY